MKWLAKVYSVLLVIQVCGAVQENPSRQFKHFQLREKEFTEQKVIIAEKALEFINDGQAIALDSGSTSLILARKLKGKFRHLTIVTNSLIIAEQVIENFYFDVSFISVSGISLKAGITAYNLETVQIQRKLIESSQKTVILADHRKFSTTSMVKVCDFSDVNVVITDNELDAEIKEQYSENGIEII